MSRSLGCFTASFAFCLLSFALPLAQAEGPADWKYVTTEAVGVAVVYPPKLAASKPLDLLPRELAGAFTQAELGVELAEIDRMVAVIEVPIAQGALPGALVFHFNKPQKFEAFTPKLRASLKAGELEGRPYLEPSWEGEPGVLKIDETTFALGNETTLRNMLRAEQGDSPLRTLLAKANTGGEAFAYLSVDAIRPMLKEHLSHAPIPSEFEFVRELPELISAIHLRIDTASRLSAGVNFLAKDEEAAIKLLWLFDKQLDSAFATAKASITEQLQRPDPNLEDPVTKAALAHLERLHDELRAMYRPQRKGKIVSFKALDIEKPDPVYTAAVAALLPAIGAARDAATRAQSLGNLKQLMLANIVYHDVKLQFPGQAIRDADGKPLLSWRVAILPHLGEGELYEEFKRDEPWDSEHNRKLIARMPAIYLSPKSALAQTDGKTHYLIPVGKGLYGDPEGKKFTYGNIHDGSSRTIGLLEVDDSHAVEWTKPNDWEFNAEQPFAGLGSLHNGNVFLVAFFDCSVHAMNKKILDAEAFKTFLTPAAGDYAELP